MRIWRMGPPFEEFVYSLSENKMRGQEWGLAGVRIGEIGERPVCPQAFGCMRKPRQELLAGSKGQQGSEALR